MRIVEQLLPDFLGACADIDPIDLGPRSHDFTHRPVRETDDAGNDRPLTFLKNARGLSFGNHKVQLLRSNLVSRFAVEAKDLEDRCAGLVEQPDERRGDLGQPTHRAGDENRDRLGRAKRELLGNELAHDQREIGHDHDHHPEAGGFGGFAVEP